MHYNEKLTKHLLKTKQLHSIVQKLNQYYDNFQIIDQFHLKREEHTIVFCVKTSKNSIPIDIAFHLNDNPSNFKLGTYAAFLEGKIIKSVKQNLNKIIEDL